MSGSLLRSLLLSSPGDMETTHLLEGSYTEKDPEIAVAYSS